jgi:O-antigen ligase
MSTLKNFNQSKILIYGAVLLTLALTPNMNKDSLIIPKVIIIFSMALFFLPTIIKHLREIDWRSKATLGIWLILALLIYSLIIFFMSTSPYEQLIYGRTGRGLGFITFFSSYILIIASIFYINFETLKKLQFGIMFAGLATSIYGVMQYFDLDFFEWDSKTNGIIGTLGNPNFQSSFAAMTFIPVIFYQWKNSYKLLIRLACLAILLFSIFIADSTQGYIGLIVAIMAFALIYYWYKSKIIASVLGFFGLASGVIALFGMLGHGPLSYYLYKISVQSRGDFWRSAIETGSNHPIFGVGFDSFGDYSLKYRDQIAANHVFAEYTDSAHNYYLDYLATGGYIFFVLNMLFTIFVFYSFYKIQLNIREFNSGLTAIFCFWLIYQLQSIVSPMSITFLAWNALVSGAILGIARKMYSGSEINQVQSRGQKSETYASISSLVFAFLALLITFPLFNSDREQLRAIRMGNGDLLIKAVTSYPESVLKYSQASRDLLSSGLPDQALYLARKSVEFNPNSPALWALILINPSAPKAERVSAKEKILELDPLNKEVENFVLP